ncbi:MAG: hypothetical protein Q8Q85_09740 [Gemmatimonadales bacterium]|nr:hypothetical protein [Gemmatimonadales bacterium]
MARRKLRRAKRTRRARINPLLPAVAAKRYVEALAYIDQSPADRDTATRKAAKILADYPDLAKLYGTPGQALSGQSPWRAYWTEVGLDEADLPGAAEEAEVGTVEAHAPVAPAPPPRTVPVRAPRDRAKPAHAHRRPAGWTREEEVAKAEAWRLAHAAGAKAKRAVPARATPATLAHVADGLFTWYHPEGIQLYVLGRYRGTYATEAIIRVVIADWRSQRRRRLKVPLYRAAGLAAPARVAG